MNSFEAYVNGLVYPIFEFVRNPDSPHNWVMIGNPGIVGTNGEYDSPLFIGQTIPEEWLRGNFGDNWQGHYEQK